MDPTTQSIMIATPLSSTQELSTMTDDSLPASDKPFRETKTPEEIQAEKEVNRERVIQDKLDKLALIQAMKLVRKNHKLTSKKVEGFIQKIETLIVTKEDLPKYAVKVENFLDPDEQISWIVWLNIIGTLALIDGKRMAVALDFIDSIPSSVYAKIREKHILVKNRLQKDILDAIHAVFLARPDRKVRSLEGLELEIKFLLGSLDPSISVCDARDRVRETVKDKGIDDSPIPQQKELVAEGKNGELLFPENTHEIKGLNIVIGENATVIQVIHLGEQTTSIGEEVRDIISNLKDLKSRSTSN
jgi:hypothetical protein